ncbi:hypothetical protein HWV62_23384 [Athelia sp. TMB]|nr:hypothetical protein HWV62_23384 [Athelia sp. TMB]
MCKIASTPPRPRAPHISPRRPDPVRKRKAQQQLALADDASKHKQVITLDLVVEGGELGLGIALHDVVPLLQYWREVRLKALGDARGGSRSHTCPQAAATSVGLVSRTTAPLSVQLTLWAIRRVLRHRALIEVHTPPAVHEHVSLR